MIISPPFIVITLTQHQMAEFTPEDAGRIGKKLAPYNPTNKDCIAIALEMMNIRDEDILFDLGCGDGRLLIEV